MPADTVISPCGMIRYSILFLALRSAFIGIHFICTFALAAVRIKRAGSRHDLSDICLSFPVVFLQTELKMSRLTTTTTKIRCYCSICLMCERNIYLCACVCISSVCLFASLSVVVAVFVWLCVCVCVCVCARCVTSHKTRRYHVLCLLVWPGRP